jgi:predicted TIM-barrel fold metal-dependent hydrolase
MQSSDANRLGLNYRDVPARKLAGRIIDIHTHVHWGPQTAIFFDAADAYGIGHVFTMTPLKDVDELKSKYGDRVRFIAIPDWKRYDEKEESRTQWIADLHTFRERHAAPICKFWMAPPMREKHGLTADHPFVQPVIDAAVQLGYHFMIHAGDPSVWWGDGKKYADTAKFGTKTEQYKQVEWLADYVAPRVLIGAHMGGTIEDSGFLQGLLDRHPNYVIDTSATKWIVREVARQPERVREFVIRNADRILFGSDLVASDKFQHFDHYASRYWAHLQMWETAYRGESPIEDPDAEQPPRLAGLSLPEDVLERICRTNAVRFGLDGAPCAA